MYVLYVYIVVSIQINLPTYNGELHTFLTTDATWLVEFQVWLENKAQQEKWNFVSKIVLTFCEKKLFYLLRKIFEIRDWRLRICKKIEITWTIYSNNERSEQFLKKEVYLTYSWRFLRSNTLEHLKFNLEKIIGI